MLQDVNAQEKDLVTFEVNINYEGVTYKWLKNGIEIRSTDRCQTRCKQLSHNLCIRNVHFGDSATYTFMAGSAVTTAKLDVEGKDGLLLFYKGMCSSSDGQGGRGGDGSIVLTTILHFMSLRTGIRLM